MESHYSLRRVAEGLAEHMLTAQGVARLVEEQQKQLSEEQKVSLAKLRSARLSAQRSLTAAKAFLAKQKKTLAAAAHGQVTASLQDAQQSQPRAPPAGNQEQPRADAQENADQNPRLATAAEEQEQAEAPQSEQPRAAALEPPAKGAVRQGDFVQVSDAKAPASIWGLLGTVAKRDEKKGTAVVTDGATQVKRTVQLSSLRRLDQLPRLGARSKNIQWLVQEQRQAFLTGYWGTFFSLPPQHRDEAHPLTAKTLLDHAELNCAAFEVLWRLLPPSTVYLKPELTDWVQATPQSSSAADDGGTAATLLADVRDLASRAGLLLAPVFSGGDPGHWTLLALWREDCRPPPQTPEPPPAPGLTGCDKCKGSSCARCSPDVAQKHFARKDAELLVCRPRDRPVLASPAVWRHRYWESLGLPNARCARKARFLLRALGVADTLEFGPSQQQTGCECGWMTVHNLEQEVRSWMGELPHVQPFDADARLARMLAVCHKLYPAETDH